MNQETIQFDRKRVDAAEMEAACTGCNGSSLQNDPAGAAVCGSLARCAQELASHAPAARRMDPEAVHRMRAAARRLRGELRAFRPLLDTSLVESLTVELRWLGRTLGDVRDLDVLRARLQESAGELAEVIGSLFAEIDQQQAKARTVLEALLDGDRYRALCDRLESSADLPGLTEEAARPCREVLPALVADIWNALKKGARALSRESEDEEFHEVRKRAKHARYAAEGVAWSVGRRQAEAARRFARAAQRVQDVLGLHQDAVVAARFVERMATEQSNDGPFHFAAGRVVERQIQAARQARADFAKVWKGLDRRRLRKWMTV
jgi:CHAD domain-containing protein